MEMTEVKETINMYAEIANELLSCIGDSTVEMQVEAARVAGARETNNTKSEKIHLAKLDQLSDSFKDQIIKMCFADVKNIILNVAEVKEEEMERFNKVCITIENLLKLMIDDSMSWYKEVMIKSSVVAIDAAYHPKKVAVDKRELDAMKAEFKAHFYNFIHTTIETGIALIKDFGEEIPAEGVEAVNYVLEICEDNVTDLRSQMTGRAKKNPITRISSATEVAKMAEETETAIKDMNFKEVETPMVKAPIPAAEPGSFLSKSIYFAQNPQQFNA